MHNMRFLRGKTELSKQCRSRNLGRQTLKSRQGLSFQVRLSQMRGEQAKFLNLAWQKARTTIYGDHHDIAAEFQGNCPFETYVVGSPNLIVEPGAFELALRNEICNCHQTPGTMGNRR